MYTDPELDDFSAAMAHFIPNASCEEAMSETGYQLIHGETCLPTVDAQWHKLNILVMISVLYGQITSLLQVNVVKLAQMIYLYILTTQYKKYIYNTPVTTTIIPSTKADTCIMQSLVQPNCNVWLKSAPLFISRTHDLQKGINQT